MSRLTKKKPGLNIYVFDRDVEYANFEDGLALLQIVGQLEDLEEEIGCPLEARLKVNHNTAIYDVSGEEYIVEFVEKDIFTVYAIFYMSYRWEDYKKTWWLKKDKSE